MTFIFKLLIVSFKVIVGVVLVSVIIIALVYVVSYAIQITARLAGREVGSFFDWLIGDRFRRFIRRRRKRVKV